MIKENFTFLTVATDVPKVTCGASCSRVDEGTAVLAGEYSIRLIGWVLLDELGSGEGRKSCPRDRPSNAQEKMLAKGKSLGMETRGVSDHGFVRSIYFRDPNGYVIELTAKTPEHDRMMDPERNAARAILDRWQQEKEKAEQEAAREAARHR